MILFLASLTFLSFVVLWFMWPRKIILADHDPNVPFTGDELKAMGILPPENYDCRTFITGYYGDSNRA